MNLMTYEEIYNKIRTDEGHRFTIYELIKIFQKESDWVGQPQQLLEIKSLIHNITGIRPGGCSGCNINAISDMGRWLTNYEKQLIENPKKPKVGRPVGK
jgi:hypothetical protein